MRFSVVVCTYNYAHLLSDALRTLAAQTFSEFEILIADDGSTDHTEEVVAKFLPEFRHCRYLKKSHTGLADTRNFALRAAQGAYIAFLDADDLWSPHYLETVQATLMERPSPDLVFCDGFAFRNDGALLEPRTRWHVPLWHGPIRSARDLFSFINAFYPSGMVFAKSLYERVGPFDVQFDEGVGDDLDWVFRALMAGARCVCLRKRLILYRRHSSNLTNHPDRFLRAWLKIHLHTLMPAQTDRRIQSLSRRFARSWSLRILDFGSGEDARRWLREASQTLGGDYFLRLLCISTYLGSVWLMKLARILRRGYMSMLRRTGKVDLSATPATLFEALPQ